jgi:hypothetical protein
LDCGGAFQATRRMTIDGGGNAKGEL